MTRAKRLVSLVPSTTLTVFDLGRGDWLVGVTRYCEEPAAAVAALPKVGGTKNPDLEKVAALDPGLVLVNTEENRPEDIGWLRARFAVHESMPRTVLQSADLLRSLGDALECREVAMDLARQVEEQVTGAVAGREPSGQRVRVFYAIWKKPWMAINQDTYIHDLLRVAGADNVTAHRPDRYPSLEVEELAGLSADLVLLPSEPFPFQDEHLREVRSAGLFGKAAVTLVDGRDYCWHGSRAISGLANARRLLRDFRSRG